LVYLVSSGVAGATANVSYTGDGNFYVGGLATLANLYVPGAASIEYLSVSNLAVTGNLIITATNVQTTNAFTINNSGTTTALMVYQNETSLHTHNVAEFWDATTLAMVIDPRGNVAIHTVSSPDYALTVTDPANFETLYIRGKTGVTNTLEVTGNVSATHYYGDGGTLSNLISFVGATGPAPTGSQGAVVYLSASATAAATAVGTASQFLKGGTTPSWSALASGDIPNNAANTSGTAAGLSGTPSISVATATASTAFVRTPASTAVAFNAPGTGLASTNYNYILAGANDTANRLVVFVNGSARTDDGGVSNVTIRNDAGSLILGNPSFPTIVHGKVGIGTASPGDMLDIQGGNLRIMGPGGNDGRIDFKRTSDGWNPVRITQQYNTGAYGGDLAFQLHPADGVAGTAPVTTMYLKAGGNVGIGTTSPGSALSFGTPIANKIITLYDGNPADSVSTATFFYGFGINGGTLRYQAAATGDIHRFYCGATLAATIAETTATFNGRVVTPNVYYIMGYLAGGTTGGNYISLGVQQSSGGMAVTTSNKLVAPISGLYHFGFNTIMNATTGRNDVSIRVNGSNIVETLNEDNGSGYHYRSGMITSYLNANDFVQFYCGSGTIYGPNAVDAWHTYFFYHVG
jgi:hypothetical protein